MYKYGFWGKNCLEGAVAQQIYTSVNFFKWSDFDKYQAGRCEKLQKDFLKISVSFSCPENVGKITSPDLASDLLRIAMTPPLSKLNATKSYQNITRCCLRALVHLTQRSDQVIKKVCDSPFHSTFEQRRLNLEKKESKTEYEEAVSGFLNQIKKAINKYHKKNTSGDVQSASKDTSKRAERPQKGF